MVLSKCCFIRHNFCRDAWRNLWLSADTGTLVACLMSPVASLVTTDRCSNVSMCLRISTKCFLFPGIVPLLYSVGNKTYYYYYYFDSKQNSAADRGIDGDGVIFLLLLKEIRLQLSHKALQQVLLQYVSHMAETDELSLVLWSTVRQNLRPHGAARTMRVYFALCQQSTLKSQNSGCVLY